MRPVELAVLLVAAVLVGGSAAVSPLLGVAAAIGLGLLLLLARWRDAIPVIAMALIYSNAVVILAQRGTVPTAAGALLVGALGFTLVRDVLQQHRVPVTPAGLPLVLAFAAVQCVSAFFSVAPGVAQGEVFMSLTQGIAVFVLVAYAIVETRSITAVVDALLLVGACLGALSLLQHFLGDYTNTFYGFAGVSNAAVPGSSTPGEDLQPRLNGNIGETNRYAQVLAVLLPLAAARAIATRRLIVKVLVLIALVLIASGVVLTYSRGVAVALLAVLITLTLMRWLNARWLVASLAVVVVVVLITPGYAQRLTTLTNVTGATAITGSSDAADAAVRGRTTEVISAVLAFADHPVLGVGPGVFPVVYPQYAAEVGIRPRLEEREAHNLYAGTAAETGVLGLLALLGLLWRLLSRLGEAAGKWSAVDRTRSLLARGFFAAVLTYAYSGMFLHLSYVRYFWLLVGLAAATARLPDAEFVSISLPWERRRSKSEPTAARVRLDA